MKKMSFSMVVLLGLGLAAPVWAQPPAQPAAGKEQAPGKQGDRPGKPDPGSRPGAGPHGPGHGPGGPKHGPGPGPGASGPGFGPRGMMGQGLSPEEMAKRAQTMKDRMAEHAERAAARAKELREKAAKARESGDVKQAEQYEKAAERLEKSPMAPERGPGWKKAMERRKRARLKPLWKQYGERLKNPEVRAEFKKHAIRMARLDRMRELARNNPDEEKRKKLIERINATVAKENARHRQILRGMMSNKEQTAGNATTPGASAVATGAAAPVAPQDNAEPSNEDENAEEEK
jgi:hypothetical protein